MVCVEAAEEESLPRTLEPGSEEWRQQVIEVIRSLYQRGGFKGHNVVSCLPGDMLKIKSLRLDTNWTETAEETMRTEVARRFGLDPEQDEIRYHYNGMLLCFLGGIISFFDARVCNPLIILKRVLRGSITSSI